MYAARASWKDKKKRKRFSFRWLFLLHALISIGVFTVHACHEHKNSRNLLTFFLHAVPPCVLSRAKLFTHSSQQHPNAPFFAAVSATHLSPLSSATPPPASSSFAPTLPRPAPTQFQQYGLRRPHRPPPPRFQMQTWSGVVQMHMQTWTLHVFNRPKT